MKKNSMLLIVLVLCAMISFSQNLSKSIISAQGSFDSTGKITLEWTLGENFVETLTRSNSILTQGFHQPLGKSKSDLQKSLGIASSFNINISPNPVTSMINIKIIGKYVAPMNVILFDINGRHIKDFPPIVSNSISYNMDNLASGTYILKISNPEGISIKTSKIIKH